MKVLVDCVPLSVGGGVQVGIALLANLCKQGNVEWAAIVPEFLRTAMPPELAEDGRVTFIAKRSRADRIWLRSSLLAFEREVAPDVVFTVFGPQCFRARSPHVVGFARPHLIYERDYHMPQVGLYGRLVDAMRCAVFSRADHFVVETQTAANRLARRLKIDPARISVIPNSPNPLLGRPLEPPERTGRFGILVPSAYYWHKNLEIIPRVAATMRRLHPDLAFDFRLTLSKGCPEWEKLCRMAADHGVSDRIGTLGVLKINELAHAYGAASAVLLPTLREVSTAVYPESFYFRRPLVTSDTDFAHELCGDAALLVPPRDANAIAQALIDIATKPELRTMLVAAGERQLSRAYPTPEEKFRLQLNMLAMAARQTISRRKLALVKTKVSTPQLVAAAGSNEMMPTTKKHQSTSRIAAFTDAAAAPYGTAAPGKSRVSNRRTLHFVVNADDLGLSKKINAAIERCIVDRTITSATLMANGPAFDEGITIAKRHTHVSIGVHLNLTEFAPVSKADLSQITRNGTFANLVRGVTLTRATVLAIADEFAAQIAKVRDVGMEISHVDSHHHIHTVPSLFSVVVRTARKFGIRRIRPTRNIFPAGEATGIARRVTKQAWNAALGLVGARAVDYFGSLTDFKESAIAYPDGSRLEIMVHPGGEGRFEDENRLLGTSWWRERCEIAVLENYCGVVVARQTARAHE
jgi:predicted glycoside hydrolase/deacetylase ChbG (UPF0249 family)/glycosyltransferase involved in cell wall biosynthesis